MNDGIPAYLKAVAAVTKGKRVVPRNKDAIAVGRCAQ